MIKMMLGTVLLVKRTGHDDDDDDDDDTKSSTRALDFDMNHYCHANLNSRTKKSLQLLPPKIFNYFRNHVQALYDL